MNDSTKRLKIYKINDSLLDVETNSIPFNSNETLLQNLIQNQIEINHSCDGHGTCTTCRVFIYCNDNSPFITERNELEQEIATDRNFAKNERLSCQIHINKTLKIVVP